MRMTFRAVAGKLLGIKYERLQRSLLVWLAVFWGLHAGDFRIQIAPSILYLMTGTLSAGVMWQALSSEDNASNMKNMFMLPFDNRQFVFSYTAALGAYVLLTRTAGLLAVALAVSSWNWAVLSGSILCGVNAVLMTACVYSYKKYIAGGLLWAGAFIAVMFLTGNTAVFLPVAAGNCLPALLLLRNADAYSFRLQTEGRRRPARVSGRCPGGDYSVRHCSAWRYLFRYLAAHKNYLVNTFVMWGVACVLPAFLGRMDTLSVMPVGFAILSLNTPVCILLSCNPALERAVRFLPGQKRAFCIPYCLFIFACNVTADAIFLCSWQIQAGGIAAVMILLAVLFALLSAAASVFLEWYFPIHSWKIESDLWHHPRKYVVPAGMLLIAGAVGTLMEAFM